MMAETIIENAEKVLLLIKEGLITKEEVRHLLGLED